MVLKSYAKINLSLSVIKKLTNGLHDIQSIFCLINLFDRITIKKLTNKKSDVINFVGPFSKYVDNYNNSIQKVLDIMRKTKLISSYYSIKVHKKIPVFAGLGGGTSNAFTVFRFLTKGRINRNILDKIIDYVGSDFRLFIIKQGLLINLKKIMKFKKKHNLHFLLVYPKIKCSSKKIYTKVKKYTKNKKFTHKNFNKRDLFINHIINQKNDLQLIVEKKYPILKRLIKNIDKEKGCYLSKMTGSGSTCYGLFINESCSKAALNSLRKKHPKFWFSIAKTI